ncbi:hypothetical protein BJ878DRAFT_527641 [Calycina marina]|uniref:Rhodopsin domain-containing protein n=1 Tax=Calycina marina TaxID=1763456 RepID=A0A9P7YUE8_9HELO|nr:hypothetical protein BJ878DRAFT_527641 [Calycina marina]
MTEAKGDGLSLLIASIVFLTLCWLTFAMRVWVRVWRKAFGADDWAMLIGIVLFTVTASLCIVCSFLGSGQFAVDIPPVEQMKGIKYFFIAEFFYASSAVAIKYSIAITLLRIATARRSFTYIIWLLIFISIAAAIVFIAGIANICYPITTLWGETPNGSCNLELNSNVSFFFSAVEILTAWSLAILPAVLLWNIQMKTSIKASVATILGMAAFASCATIVRLRFLSLYSDPTEFMYGTGKIGLWSIIELGIGIFAGSLPAVRPLLSNSLFGSSSNDSDAISGDKYNNPRTRNELRSRDVTLDTFHLLVDKESNDNSQKYILKETQVTVMTNDRVGTSGEWEKKQVLGWKKDNGLSRSLGKGGGFGEEKHNQFEVQGTL